MVGLSWSTGAILTRRIAPCWPPFGFVTVPGRQWGTLVTKDEYFRLLGQAIAGFLDVAKELEANPEGPVDLQHWNDEFMLELYEVTKDPRRA